SSSEAALATAPSPRLGDTAPSPRLASETQLPRLASETQLPRLASESVPFPQLGPVWTPAVMGVRGMGRSQAFFRNFSTIMLFAVVGTIISTLVFGFLTYALYAMGAVRSPFLSPRAQGRMGGP
ncbi:hypothetical protein CYMTET_36168, partial [Cymbomonas tetramitiformis]